MKGATDNYVHLLDDVYLGFDLDPNKLMNSVDGLGTYQDQGVMGVDANGPDLIILGWLPMMQDYPGNQGVDIHLTRAQARTLVEHIQGILGGEGG